MGGSLLTRVMSIFGMGGSGGCWCDVAGGSTAGEGHSHSLVLSRRRELGAFTSVNIGIGVSTSLLLRVSVRRAVCDRSRASYRF